MMRWGGPLQGLDGDDDFGPEKLAGGLGVSATRDFKLLVKLTDY